MRERFVFVSHAGEDKRAIRPIVAALIAAGEKVWLDNPAAMGFSKAEIDSHFYRLRAGNRWHDDIHDGLERAGCVLLLLSNKIHDPRRRVWREEAIYARTANVLIAARLEKVDLADDADYLPYEVSAEQMADLRPQVEGWSSIETRVALLVEDVQNKLKEVLSRRVVSRERRDQLAPYLINRSIQESAIADAVRELDQQDGVRSFLVAGPDNEAREAFRERLGKYTCKRCLPDEMAWIELDVAWPVGAPVAEFPLRYLKNLRRALPREKALGSGATAQDVGAALADFRRPVAVFSSLHPEAWQRDEATRVRAWLAFWGEMRNVHGLRALPILWVALPRATAGWKRHFDDPRRGGRECPPGGERGAPPNRAIWRAARAVAMRPKLPRSNIEPAPFDLLPILHPVRERDVDPWLRAIAPDGVVSSDWATSVRTKAIDLLGSGRVKRQGLPLDDFAAGVKSTFGKG